MRLLVQYHLVIYDLVIYGCQILEMIKVLALPPATYLIENKHEID